MMSCTNMKWFRRRLSWSHASRKLFLALPGTAMQPSLPERNFFARGKREASGLGRQLFISTSRRSMCASSGKICMSGVHHCCLAASGWCGTNENGQYRTVFQGLLSMD